MTNYAQMSQTALAAVIVLAAAGIFAAVYAALGPLRIRRRIRRLSSRSMEITPAAFFRLRAEKRGEGGELLMKRMDFAGVYILYNQTRNMYYVGQGKQVFHRVNQHFTGHGNGDVYADYKYGDAFSIRMIPLRRSGFHTLNELERHTISQYDAFSRGYNKTRGNSG